MTNKYFMFLFVDEGYVGRHQNLISNGNVLYSYGEHWPLVYRSSDGIFFINEDRYSRTTSRHRTDFFRILTQRCIPEHRIQHVSKEDLKNIIEGDKK